MPSTKKSPKSPKSPKSSPKSAPAESPKSPTRETAATVAATPVATKGVPGLRIYSNVFPVVLAESGKSATLAALVALATPRVEAAGEAGRAYVSDGSLLSRTRQFFRDIADRARGVRGGGAPFPVPGRAGGIVYGPRTATGEATLVYSATAAKVEAPALVGAPAESKSAKKSAK